jgi:hypothetical protein
MATWGTDDDDFGDLHLPSGSPCVDAGNNAAVPPTVTVDLDGNPRFIDDPTTPDSGVPRDAPPLVGHGSVRIAAQRHHARRTSITMALSTSATSWRSSTPGGHARPAGATPISTVMES